MAKEQPGGAAGVGGRGPCARLAREVLDRLAAPELRDTILSAALRASELTEVPEDPASFGAFACGPLRDAVELMLGAEEASAVTADLSPAFALDGQTASSGVRRRKRASLAAPSDGAPVVVVASADSDAVDTLAGRLKERAKFIAAYDVFALLSTATQHTGGPLTVLLHDEMPALRASSLSTLARVLPIGTRIIVWGKTGIGPQHREGIEWIELGPVEDVEAVADVCIARWPSVAPKSASSRTVVIAHPDATWRAKVSRMLTSAGYRPVSVPDGFLALERCIEEPPSALIAAFAMDAIDGAQLASLVKSRFGEDGPPVLLVSDGSLPEPPPGSVAVILSDALEDDLLPELAVWIGPG